MKKFILGLVLAASCFARNNNELNSNEMEGLEKIDIKTLESTVPLLLSSVRLWANIHEEDINTFSVDKFKEVTNSKEFYGIRMVTYFEYCKLENNEKTVVICIDKDYIEDATRQYVDQGNKAAANSSGEVFFDGKMFGEVKLISAEKNEGFKDINCSNFSKKAP